MWMDEGRIESSIVVEQEEKEEDNAARVLYRSKW